MITLLRQCLYGLDLENLYPYLGVAAANHAKAVACQQKHEERILRMHDKVEMQRKPVVCAETVTRWAFIEHFRQVLVQATPGRYFSIEDEISQGALKLPDLQDVLSVQGSCFDLSCDVLLAPQQPSNLPINQVPVYTMTKCFQVLKANPGAWHTISASKIAKHKLTSKDILVSTHQLFRQGSVVCATSSHSGHRMGLES